MARHRISVLLKSAAFCALFALLTTGCAKEELVAPVSNGEMKCGDGTPGSTNGDLGNSGPKGNVISDDGDDQADNEKSKKKGR